MRWPCLHWGREKWLHFLDPNLLDSLWHCLHDLGAGLKCRISGFTADLPVGICYLTRFLDNSHTQSILRSTALDPLGWSTCKNTTYSFCRLWRKFLKTFETVCKVNYLCNVHNCYFSPSKFLSPVLLPCREPENQSASHTLGPAISLTPVGPSSRTILCAHVPSTCPHRIRTECDCRCEHVTWGRGGWVLGLSCWPGDNSSDVGIIVPEH